jgi:two-component system response regulator DesR
VSIRILIADERRLIAVTLDLVSEFEVVDIVDDGSKVVEAVRLAQPTAVVLGRLALHQDALLLAADIRRVVPGCGVAVIASDLCRSAIDSAVRNGLGCSLVPSNARIPHLVHAIHGAVNGFPTIDPALLHHRLTGHSSLSDRERDVLRLTARGTPPCDIARELFLALGTVRNLTSSAMRKVGGRNRFEAAQMASEQDLL